MISTMSAEYQPTCLVTFLHKFPRLDFTFKKTDNTFNADSQLYVEALLFWGAVPIVWLLFSLLLFLIYFCYRCCQRDVETKQRMPCLMWSLSILALVTCCVLGVGFGGVVEIKRGADEVVDALQDINSTMYRVRKQVTLLYHARDDVADAISAVDSLSTNPVLFPNRTDIGQRAREAQGYMRSLTSDLTALTRMTNDTRPPVTAAEVHSAAVWLTVGLAVFLGWCLVQCLILLLAVGRSSKCTLLVYCALGIMTMVLLWMLAGTLLTASLGLSDFCVNPNKHVEKAAAKNGPAEAALVKYYIDCPTGAASDSLVNAVQQSTGRLVQVNQTLQPVLMGAKRSNIDVTSTSQQLAKSLVNVRNNITSLYALVDCTNIHEDYVDARDGVCRIMMLGTVLLWCSCVATGLLFTILVILASKAWRHMGKGKGYELVSYEANPYAREPPDAGLPPSSCQFYSSTRGSRGNPREHVALHHRSTPPPAYNCNEFYRTYSDMNQLADDQRSDVGGRNTLS